MADTVLAIGAHPDDVELGMGGTIASLVQRGCRVVILDLSDGEPTPNGTPQKRAQETRLASEALGVSERLNAGLPCREIQDSIDARTRVATIIRQVKPSVLFVPHWEDSHPDHVQASALCDAARFYAKFVKTTMAHEPHIVRKTWYYYSIHLRARVDPALLVDISEQVDKKRKALEAYHSQFLANPRNKEVIDRVLLENHYWGAQAYCRAAEPFTARERVRVMNGADLLNM